MAFSVPTGNFGNVFAGYVAVQMGLPVERLIIASNQNDYFYHVFASGAMAREIGGAVTQPVHGYSGFE